MITLMTAGSLAMSMLFTPSAPDAAAPVPASATIEVVTANGSGCPVNTLGAAEVRMSTDRRSVTISYPSFIAVVGIGPATGFRKNCQLGLRIDRPDGYTFAVARIDQSGFAHLAAGATALARSAVYFQGTSPTAFAEKAFTGPLDEAWQSTTTFGLADLVWQPCGTERDVNINQELRVSAGSSDPSTSVSLMAMETTDISTYHLVWRRCG